MTVDPLPMSWLPAAEDPNFKPKRGLGASRTCPNLGVDRCVSWSVTRESLQRLQGGDPSTPTKARRRDHTSSMPMAVKLARLSPPKPKAKPAVEVTRAKSTGASAKAWYVGRGRWRGRRGASSEEDLDEVAKKEYTPVLDGSTGAAPMDLVEALEALFAAYDTNSNGIVDVDEFVSAKRIEKLARGKEADDRASTALFLRADVKRFACLRFDDFKKWHITDFTKKGLSIAKMIDLCKARAEEIAIATGLDRCAADCVKMQGYYNLDRFTHAAPPLQGESQRKGLLTPLTPTKGSGAPKGESGGKSPGQPTASQPPTTTEVRGSVRPRPPSSFVLRGKSQMEVSAGLELPATCDSPARGRVRTLSLPSELTRLEPSVPAKGVGCENLLEVFDQYVRDLQGQASEGSSRTASRQSEQQLSVRLPPQPKEKVTQLPPHERVDRPSRPSTPMGRRMTLTSSVPVRL
eukprot:TRINITY_DN9767_c0_g1_i1.p1 TRINITY_DN9767_c0_g1~~TRINITY_DN9767_c0_g1_i1.p1  ORF type:complete len:488 (-),score=89.03 TRINITY_DN9767_c0_g1_i1:26-1411(-)